MLPDDTKRENIVSLRVTDREMLDLGRIAAAEDRKLAELVHYIVRSHLYGHIYPCTPEMEDAKSISRSAR